MGSTEPHAEAGRSHGWLIFAWPLLGAPLAGLLIAEFLYQAAGIRSWTLLTCAFVFTGLVTWLISWRSGFTVRRALWYSLGTLAVLVGLFAFYAHSVSGNLN